MVNGLGALQEVLEFYRPFAQTFSRNLSLTFDLSKRMVFSKVKAYKHPGDFMSINNSHNLMRTEFRVQQMWSKIDRSSCNQSWVYSRVGDNLAYSTINLWIKIVGNWLSNL